MCPADYEGHCGDAGARTKMTETACTAVCGSYSMDCAWVSHMATSAYSRYSVLQVLELFVFIFHKPLAVWARMSDSTAVPILEPACLSPLPHLTWALMLAEGSPLCTTTTNARAAARHSSPPADRMRDRRMDGCKHARTHACMHASIHTSMSE